MDIRRENCLKSAVHLFVGWSQETENVSSSSFPTFQFLLLTVLSNSQFTINCSVIGSGSFGTVIASILSRNESNVTTLWCRRNEVAEEISKHKTHTTYFQNAPSSFLKNVHATSDFEHLKVADIVVIAVPSQYLNQILEKAAKYIPENAVIVSLIKSLHLKNGEIEFTSRTIETFTRKNQVVVLHGPNIYTEMTDEMKSFAEATIGYRNTRMGVLAARKVKRAFDSKNFHTKLKSFI